MRVRKRMLAGILAVTMMAASLQFPGETVFAKELTAVAEEEPAGIEAEVKETGEGVDEQQPAISGKEDVPADDSAAVDNSVTTDESAAVDDDVPADDSAMVEDSVPANDSEAVEDSTLADDSVTTDGGEAPGEDGEGEAAAPDREENGNTSVSDNTLQVSGNDLMGSESQGIIVTDELDGVYQFGDAPSGQPGRARLARAVTSYSDSAEAYVYQRMLAREERIDISNYNITDDATLSGLVSGVLNEHPDLYFVNKGYKYGYNSAGTQITLLILTYDNTYDDAAFRQAVNKAQAVVSEDMSDLQKAIVLHDYLAVNCEYDEENLEKGTVPTVSHSAYGSLVNRIAVCDGYALAYKYLLSQWGINCFMVTSRAMSHAWNLVELDGNYYQVDVTWDDPVWDRIGRVAHNYMFCSDAVFMDADHKHHDWSVTYGSEVVAYEATDTSYDSAFWIDCTSPIVFDGSDCYYVLHDASSHQNKIKKGTLADIRGEGTAVQGIAAWPVWGSSMFYTNAFSGLFQMDGRLFYNDKEHIYSIAIDGTDTAPRTEFTADTTDGYIYGSALCQGKVVYVLHKDPSERGRETVLTAEITVGGGEPEVPDTPGDNEGGLNLENLTAEYTALDDTKISSAAAGKPKILIFYSNTCYNCRSTIKSISGEIDAFGGADVYAIETNNGTKQAVLEFQSQYGCDEIVFSYDIGGNNSRSMVNYARLTGIMEGNTISWPVICYIDADNRLQYATKSIKTADEVLSNLEKYCDYSYVPKETYRIIYELDGGTNNSANPDKYTPGTDTIILQDPVKEGYLFDGWYMDAEYLVRVTRIEGDRTGDLKLYAKWVKGTGSLQGADVTLKTGTFTYNGAEQRPKVVVSVSDSASADGRRVLTEGQDYELTYRNNIDAGTAVVLVNGINDYSGTVSKIFEIEPAPLVIRAKNKTILVGDPLPAGSEYEYEMDGLIVGDSLVVKPSFFCRIFSSAVAGWYDIIPYGAAAGPNYKVFYENGRLTVAEEYVSCRVIFDVQGHGTAPADQFGIQVGSTIEKPKDPTAAGYRFGGWYRDAACSKAWNFETDIVQADMVLYAKWLGIGVDNGTGNFALQEISDVIYTGKPCKPAVSVYDGETLLKSGRDYQIKYYNNTDANVNGQRKTGNGAGIYFRQELPYVEIIGKGNYTEAVKVNFNILKASIGGGESPAAGVTLKVTDQLVTADKVLKPFGSIKYVKGMRLDADYALSLTPVNAFDSSGNSLPAGTKLENAWIPAGCSGEFLLTVTGKGNYEGSIRRTIYVADKAHLIKNAKITLGQNLKNIRLTDKTVKLTAATEDGPDVFTVKCGNVILTPGLDYTCRPSNLEFDRAGKAELTIVGAGAYAGSKATTFNIQGKAFSARTVKVEDMREDKEYTGRALTQNTVKLIYCDADTGAEKTLKYGTDYTISYSNNINKGTASMIFKGNEEAGYSGSFKKTFKITAADIAKVNRGTGMQRLVFSYSKAGVKPVEEIILTNQSGVVLRNGKDYTLKYVNNKAVAKPSDANPPTITVKGKGNYTGELNIYFEIEKADLNTIAVVTVPAAYKNNKAPDFAYKPAVKLMDGKTALQAGKDYEIRYQNNTQADYDAYMETWGNPTVTNGGMPVAIITGKEDSPYRLNGSRTVPLPIYQTKLAKNNLQVDIVDARETVYTDGQVKPPVKVYYGTEKRLLTENKDYTISYGVNNKSGKNKGSITIIGAAPEFGGSVTVKFDILQKTIVY